MILHQASKPSFLLEICEKVAVDMGVPTVALFFQSHGKRTLGHCHHSLDVSALGCAKPWNGRKLQTMIVYQPSKPNFLFEIFEKVALDTSVLTVHPFLQSQGKRTPGHCQHSLDVSAAERARPWKGRKLQTMVHLHNWHVLTPAVPRPRHRGDTAHLLCSTIAGPGICCWQRMCCETAA